VKEKIPPLSNCPMCDLKRILCGEMKTFQIEKCPSLPVPKYPELTVEAAYEKFKNDEDTMKFLPTFVPKKRLPDRCFVYDVLQKLHPKMMDTIITHAKQTRMMAKPAKEY
jgi:hypothetical protein